MKTRTWNYASLVVLLCTPFLLARLGQTAAPNGAGSRPGKIAAKPLFRDPVYDGAADPVVVWNRAEKKWFMRSISTE